MPPTLHALLEAMTDKGASDLHVTAGSPPRLRIGNELDDCLGRSSEVEELKTMILGAGGSLGSMAPPATARR